MYIIQLIITSRTRGTSHPFYFRTFTTTMLQRGEGHNEITIISPKSLDKVRAVQSRPLGNSLTTLAPCPLDVHEWRVIHNSTNYELSHAVHVLLQQCYSERSVNETPVISPTWLAGCCCPEPPTRWLVGNIGTMTLDVALCSSTMGHLSYLLLERSGFTLQGYERYILSQTCQLSDQINHWVVVLRKSRASEPSPEGIANST